MSGNDESESQDHRDERLDAALRRLGEDVLAEPVPERLLRALREARAGRQPDTKASDTNGSEADDAEEGRGRRKTAED